jgi:hypothetical protein
VTGHRVTMFPDISDWELGSIQWVAFPVHGLRAVFTDPGRAARCADDAAALGFYVTIDPPLPAPLAWYRAVELTSATGS